MTSSVISFVYFTQFSNLNIFETYVDICKWETVCLFFHGIQYDTQKDEGENISSKYHLNLSDFNFIW